MNAPDVFDEVAPRYGDTVNASIGASGEDVDYFAVLKARLMAEALAGTRVDRLLDFGCGTGTSTRAIAGQCTQVAEIVGCDPSAESIRIAQGEPAERRVRFEEQSSPARLAFPDGHFDVAFTACVFHHIPRDEQPRWMGELRRVVRPGGSLFVFEHNPYNPLTRRAIALCPFDEGVELLTPSYTRSLMRGAGFEPTSAHHYFFFPRALAALRPAEVLLRRVPLGAQYYVRGRR